MTTRLILIALLMAVFCSQLPATIINIPADYATIQAGIDASVDGDTVLVQPGTYHERFDFSGHNITLGSLFLTAGDTSYVSNTVISGDAEGTIITIANGEDSTASIRGLTLMQGDNELGGAILCQGGVNPVIANNRITNNYSYQGSGIYIENSRPTIINNYFIADTSAHDGAAIACDESDPLIHGNTFLDNFGDCGAAVFCGEYSDPVISDNVMINNRGMHTGGAIGCRYGANPYIVNNIIMGNRANYGGGIGCSSASATIERNLIVSNQGSIGGGICATNTGSLNVINNTISKNIATGGGGNAQGGGIYFAATSLVVINTILWADNARSGNREIFVDTRTIQVSYCDIQGGWSGNGNIDLDPMFIDPDNGDYHLLTGSPCIDAGDPESPLDPDSTRADIGAFFFDHTVGIDNELVELPSGFSLLQNYPNPFNASTKIWYSLPVRESVRLEIYNVLGQHITTLFDDIQPVGNHSIVWNAGGYPSGMYFAKLLSEESSESIKMVLLK